MLQEPYWLHRQTSQEHKYGEALKVFELGVKITAWDEEDPPIYCRKYHGTIFFPSNFKGSRNIINFFD